MQRVQNFPINSETRLIGLVADPIQHVQTPPLMNRLLLETKTNAVIIPMHVGAADFAPCLKSMTMIRNMSGLIVTIPHKVAASVLCDELGTAGRKIGAVNAIRFEHGRIFGDMFDGFGFVQGLRNNGVFPGPETRVYLAGAGGAARAIAFCLLEIGIAQLTIHNRSATRAEKLLGELAEHFPNVVLRMGNRSAAGHDLVINGTSAGLSADDPLPMDPGSCERSAVVADIVMNPRVTTLLAAAQDVGCQIVYGESMLHAQVALLAAYVLAMPELAVWKLKEQG